MRAIDFDGTTRVLGVRQGYDPLPVRDMTLVHQEAGIMHAMMTMWQPDEEERKRIAAGEPIAVVILSDSHPPIKLGMRERAPDYDIELEVAV